MAVLLSRSHFHCSFALSCTILMRFCSVVHNFIAVLLFHNFIAVLLSPSQFYCSFPLVHNFFAVLLSRSHFYCSFALSFAILLQFCSLVCNFIAVLLSRSQFLLQFSSRSQFKTFVVSWWHPTLESPEFGCFILNFTSFYDQAIVTSFKAP